MRTVGVVTGARSDYGIYLPILREIQGDSGLELCLMVSGMHLAREFGYTVQEIERDGFEVAERVEMLLASDSPEGIAKSMGLGTVGFSQVFARTRPDILLLLGDRFEMHAAAVAALPFKIALAHIHGGESTEGLIDEPIRHSLTKMSHLHFASTQRYASRIVQMGEEPWRVTVSGAPSLDNLRYIDLLSKEEIQSRYGLDLSEPPLLVTYHPVTLEYERTEWQISELLAALEAVGRPAVFTYPNADTYGRTIIQAIDAYAERHPGTKAVKNLGTQGYFSLMNVCAAMVGNSSSGILEAASFKLPVVNIGNRQRGRVHGSNVIDVGYGREEVLAGTQKALSSEFRAGLAHLTNLYGDGHAAERIVEVLRTVQIDDRLLIKRFYEVSKERPECGSSSSAR
jgi:UDP-hydrolysing UDP-N-acetyl-D-glucosamine 2-epimerase